ERYAIDASQHETWTLQACGLGLNLGIDHLAHFFRLVRSPRSPRDERRLAGLLHRSRMLFSQVIVKNLRRRWARTALTILGLAVAVTATTTLWNIAWGYADSAKEFYSDRGVDIVVVRAGVANRLTSSLRSDLATRLKAV